MNVIYFFIICLVYHDNMFPQNNDYNWPLENTRQGKKFSPKVYL